MQSVKLSQVCSHSALANGHRVPSYARCVALASSRQEANFFRGELVLQQKRVAFKRTTLHNTLTEANLVGRFARVVRSTVFFYGNSAVSETEDPAKLLDVAVEEMKSDVAKMREAAANVFATQRTLEGKYRQAEKAAEDWYKRAEFALSKGDEDLAKQALTRRKTFLDTANAFKKQLDPHTKAVQQLNNNIRIMEAKVAEALSKKETLKARAISAAATKELNEQLNFMVGSLRSTANGSLATFDRMEQKVLALEAEAEAAGQFGFAGDDLETRFAMLESGGGVDDELLKLKTDMLKSGRSLPAPESRVPSYITFQ